jgi:hypothetical protein
VYIYYINDREITTFEKCVIGIPSIIINVIFETRFYDLLMLFRHIDRFLIVILIIIKHGKMFHKNSWRTVKYGFLLIVNVSSDISLQDCKSMQIVQLN